MQVRACTRAQRAADHLTAEAYDSVVARWRHHVTHVGHYGSPFAAPDRRPAAGGETVIEPEGVGTDGDPDGEAVVGVGVGVDVGLGVAVLEGFGFTVFPTFACGGKFSTFCACIAAVMNAVQIRAG